MSATFSDLPDEVLEAIMIHLAKKDPICAWNASRVNSALYRVIRNLLSSKKYGKDLAEGLVMGLPRSDFIIFMTSCYMKVWTKESFDFQRFISQYMRWRSIAPPAEGVKKQSPKKVANISDLLENRWPDLSKVVRNGDTMFLYDEATQKAFVITLDFHEGFGYEKFDVLEDILSVDNLDESNYQYDWKRLYQMSMSDEDIEFPVSLVPKSQELEICALIKGSHEKVTVNTMPHLRSFVTCAVMTCGTLILGTAIGEVFAYHVQRHEDLVTGFDWSSYFWAGAPATYGKAIRHINFEFTQSKNLNTPEFVILAATEQEIMWWEVKE